MRIVARYRIIDKQQSDHQMAVDHTSRARIHQECTPLSPPASLQRTMQSACGHQAEATVSRQWPPCPSHITADCSGWDPRHHSKPTNVHPLQRASPQAAPVAEGPRISVCPFTGCAAARATSANAGTVTAIATHSLYHDHFVSVRFSGTLSRRHHSAGKSLRPGLPPGSVVPIVARNTNTRPCCVSHCLCTSLAASSIPSIS